ncbi:enoyl-CoA hydratase/isomerase family protein [Roseinatronobacter alkalisoli]|uniref:Enoyl-CoA hydratase/isomerase family protein n=1 Tax=Roseinatronobacter alkalisoli TaxID=3028235 RepID=A0ABT5TDC9_9RHOB|nr:enoyl-CoA hydratase/isomerase family protein [Roseinatronobacter sp. HJB301]MDD7973104.1 enoyl-CoA hydratase/isomerase family protein [Roseinatronobacter sp. HJB301]
MNFENIRYEEADGIAEITICRPEKRNALTARMFTDLRQCWDKFAHGDARVAILKSCDDKVFSAGADLKDPPELFWHAVPEFGFRCDKPIIAAISGKAIGAGLVLAMMCDFIVLTEDAELIYPEAKIGVAKGAVSALAKRGALRVVQEMILLGDPIAARRAYDCGMVNRLVPAGTHVAEAQRMARRLADNAPLVIAMLKRMSLDAVGDTPIQTLFDVTRKVDTVMNSEDAANALDAFRNKRPPVFRGR